MQRQQQLAAWLHSQFPGVTFTLAPASADASFRRYFRATFADGGGCDTLLAKPADCGSSRQAAHHAPEGFATPYQGGGCDKGMRLQKNYDCVSSDEMLAGMFASAAGVTFAEWSAQWRDEQNSGRQLLVWTGLRSALRRGDLDAWRNALQEFETGYAQPLWRALRAGKVARLQVDILGGERAQRLSLTRADAWTFWRRAKPLGQYSMGYPEKP